MKAIALLSGGLDSTLAVRIILDQGIEVEALKFTSPFCQCDHGGRCYSAEAARELNIPIKTIAKGNDYLDILKNPKYGYGSGLNPCIDCRIYMLKKAKEYAESEGAGFVFTGEVLGQRPMSQHLKALKIIEKDAGLEGKLLRPLSARHLTETEAEKNGWVDRSRLLSITGRSRKVQFELTKEYGINSFSCPAGGCLLTDKNFVRRMKDFIDHNEDIKIRDINLLKLGRHFRFKDSKIIVGRKEEENISIERLRSNTEMLFEAADCPGPAVMLQGEITPAAVELAAAMTASYSDAKCGQVAVLYGCDDKKQSMQVTKTGMEDFARFLI